MTDKERTHRAIDRIGEVQSRFDGDDSLTAEMIREFIKINLVDSMALFLGVFCAGGGANRPGLRVGVHARGFPPAGKHGFRGGSAARRQLGLRGRRARSGR